MDFAAEKQYKFLSAKQVDHFMAYGWAKIQEAFGKDQAVEWSKDLWTRLGYDPEDKSTWVLEKINMPAHCFIDSRKFAPKAWGAICELVGGEER